MTEKEGESMAAQDQKHPVEGGVIATNLENMLLLYFQQMLEDTRKWLSTTDPEPVVAQ